MEQLLLHNTEVGWVDFVWVNYVVVQSMTSAAWEDAPSESCAAAVQHDRRHGYDFGAPCRLRGRISEKHGKTTRGRRLQLLFLLGF